MTKKRPSHVYRCAFGLRVTERPRTYLVESPLLDGTVFVKKAKLAARLCSWPVEHDCKLATGVPDEALALALVEAADKVDKLEAKLHAARRLREQLSIVLRSINLPEERTE